MDNLGQSWTEEIHFLICVRISGNRNYRILDIGLFFESQQLRRYLFLVVVVVVVVVDESFIIF